MKWKQLHGPEWKCPSEILTGKVQCQERVLLTLLMLTAGVMDSDAYLDAVGVNSIFLSPETGGWSHNCLLGLFSQDTVGIYKSLLSHSLDLNRAMHSQSHLSELGWLWKLCHLLIFPPLLFHIMLLLVVAKMLLKVTEFQTTQQSQPPDEHETQAEEAFSVITPWSC